MHGRGNKMKKQIALLLILLITAAAWSSKPLSEFLNADGTLDTQSGFQGSLDPSGYNLIAEEDGTPRFVSKKSNQPTTYTINDDEGSWAQLTSGINGTVRAIACSGSNVYVGGRFTQAGGTPVNNIARWDGSSWSALGSGINDWVFAIACSGNDVYVGGEFSEAGGTPASNITRWDGNSWNALGSGIDLEVFTIACSGDIVYVGGYFTQAGGIPASNIAQWDGSSWNALGNGVNLDVYTIACSGDIVYVGGEFSEAGGAPANYVAQWDGSSWSVLGNGVNSWVEEINVSGNDVYVGGNFTQAGTAPANHIARWDGSSWSALGSGTTARVNSLAFTNNNLYAGGYFWYAGDVYVKHIAKWDGSTWSNMDGGTNDFVFALASCGTDIYAGGDFSLAGGIPCSHVAVYHAAAAMPDLIVTNVSVIDGVGPDIVHKVTVKNIGNAQTSGKIKTRFYLSQDNIITTSDYLINDWNFTDPLAPGASRTSYDFYTTVSGVPSGEYYMGVITDANNECAESDENNNTGYAESMVNIPEGTEESDSCEGNLITNWSFSNGMDDWQFLWGGAGVASCTTENGVFHAHITQGGDYFHEVSLHHYGITMVNGNTYTVTFDARADSPRDIRAWVAMSEEPWILYNSDYEFSVTTDWQTFTYTFTMDYPTDPYARLGFDFGTSDTDVYIDHVCLVETGSSTGIIRDEQPSILNEFDLVQNFPNPFNPVTTIRYAVPKSGFVNLKIYNLLGKEIATLVNEKKMPGEYSVQWNGQGLCSGIYLCYLKTGDSVVTKKIILQK